MFSKILFFGFSAGVGLFHREALCCHSFFTTARSGSPAARQPGELEARLPTWSPGQVAWQPEPAWKAADVGKLVKPVNLGRFSIAGTPFRRMGYRQYPIPWNSAPKVLYSVLLSKSIFYSTHRQVPSNSVKMKKHGKTLPK